MKRSLLLLGLCVAALSAPAIRAAETTLRVLIVFGVPGHTAVHLQRAGRQLYWDPGGEYGLELDHCLQARGSGNCTHFAGFPWERLRLERRNDVVFDELADLTRVLSIYHLDGDDASHVYTFRLMGEEGRRAWDYLYQGAIGSSQAEFDTDRMPSFCVKSVAEYLNRLGGRFAQLPRPWFPGQLDEAMKRLGATPSAVYSLDHPEVLSYIRVTRSAAGLDPLPSLAEKHQVQGKSVGVN